MQAHGEGGLNQVLQKVHVQLFDFLEKSIPRNLIVFTFSFSLDIFFDINSNGFPYEF